MSLNIILELILQTQGFPESLSPFISLRPLCGSVLAKKEENKFTDHFVTCEFEANEKWF